MGPPVQWVTIVRRKLKQGRLILAQWVHLEAWLVLQISLIAQHALQNIIARNLGLPHLQGFALLATFAREGQRSRGPLKMMIMLVYVL